MSKSAAVTLRDRPETQPPSCSVCVPEEWNLKELQTYLRRRKVPAIPLHKRWGVAAITGKCPFQANYVHVEIILEDKLPIQIVVGKPNTVVLCAHTATPIEELQSYLAKWKPGVIIPKGLPLAISNCNKRKHCYHITLRN